MVEVELCVTPETLKEDYSTKGDRPFSDRQLRRWRQTVGASPFRKGEILKEGDVFSLDQAFLVVRLLHKNLKQLDRYTQYGEIAYIKICAEEAGIPVSALLKRLEHEYELQKTRPRYWSRLLKTLTKHLEISENG